MKKIKLLYGLEAAGGGALKHLVYLVTRLNKELFTITVVLSNSRCENISDEISKIESAGVNVIFLPMANNINLLKDCTTIFKLLSILKRQQFDIVHAHSSKAGALFRIAARLCKIPVIIYTPHCFYFQGKTWLKRKVFVLIERFLASTTSVVIVSENEQKEVLNNRVFKPFKVKNINNAIDFNEYQLSKEIDNTRDILGIPKNAFIIGAIGRLVSQKDWETYIYAASEVLKKHTEVVFLVVGEGELKNEIQKLIFKLGLDNKVILTGYVNEIHKIYGIIDIFVNTSLWEGLPYVFLEAMRYNKPIIATNTGNEKVIMNEESGFVSAVKDYRSIAEKIIILIENKQMAVRMGTIGMEKLTQKYSFEIFIQKHEELYKSLSNVLNGEKN